MALGLERAIAQVLEDAGLGIYGTGATATIYVGDEPDHPDEILTVLLEGAGPPTLTVSEEHAFTVRTRGVGYESAAERARAVHDALHEYQGEILGVPMARVSANFMPVPLSRDLAQRGGRFGFTQTFTVRTKRFTYQ